MLFSIGAGDQTFRVCMPALPVYKSDIKIPLARLFSTSGQFQISID
jgi:hypothetical protein